MVLDPFSAASKPFVPPDEYQPKRPLPFAATLDHPKFTRPKPKLPNKDRDREALPTSYPQPPYSHSRQGSSASITSVNHVTASLDLFGLGSPGAKSREVGSDEWMIELVSRCVDAANGTLQINGLGLTSLSTKIADLRDLVTLPKPSSPKPRVSLGPPRSPHANSRYPDLSLSPGSNHLSANARSFTRSSSAPASSAFFSNMQQPGYSRIPSGLGAIVQSPGSPTTTEASEDADEARSQFTSPRRNPLMASPSLPSPSTPPASVSVSPDEGKKRSFGRSKTGAFSLTQRKAMDIEIFAAQNHLTSLPSALFEVTNLTFLTLRGNQIKALPAAIGELRHLKALNIGLNRLTYLPSTILDLPLEMLHATPNEWIKKEPEVERFSNLIRHYDTEHPVPRLTTLCMNLLLSPRPPNDLPPLLDMYEWDAPTRGIAHPLLDADAMHDIIPGATKVDVERVLQALRTASTQQNHRRRTGGGSSGSLNANADPFPRSHRPAPIDDASTNPFFSPCPSPRHHEYDAEVPAHSRPSRHIFLHPAEERIEWREVCNVKDLPIRWMGCSPGCLAFLDDDDDDAWSLGDTDVDDE
ncbi:hypothetical protein IAU60_001813 [Kwoniella sp. DSM 27419]